MATTKVPTHEQLKTTIHEFIVAINDHDLDAVMDHFTDDAVWEGPAMDDRYVGREAIRTMLEELFTAFPDIHYPLDDLEVHRQLDGESALSFWTLVMTMQGPWGGFAPTGRTARGRGVCRYEFADGRFRRHTVVYDERDLAEQLGLLPAEDSLAWRTVASTQRLVKPVIDRFGR